MNYTIGIDKTAGIRALKLKAVAGLLTTANSILNIDDEFAAICGIGDAVVVFESDTTTFSLTIPVNGVPTGNYELYSSDDAVIPVWNQIVEVGILSILNNDAGGLISAKKDTTAVDAELLVITNDITAIEAAATTLTGRVATAESDIDALELSVNDIETELTGLLLDPATLSVKQAEIREINDFVLFQAELWTISAQVYGVGNFIWNYYFDGDVTPDFATASPKSAFGNSNLVVIPKPKAGDAVYVGAKTFLHLRAKWRALDGVESSYSTTFSLQFNEPV